MLRSNRTATSRKMWRTKSTVSQHLPAWRLAQRLYGLIQAPTRVALSERGSEAVPYDKTAAAARLRERRRRSRVRSGRRVNGVTASGAQQPYRQPQTLDVRGRRLRDHDGVS